MVKRARILIKVLLGMLLLLLILGIIGYFNRDKLIQKSISMLPGNSNKYNVENVEELKDSILKGKKIIFLGSSVTEGATSMGTSFVEYMEKRDGISAVKEAVSGTTLVTEGDKNNQSYISRMKKLDTNMKVDAFICQLSTNDATQKKELGKVEKGFDKDSFNTDTVAGAIEYIIAYAQETWKCPVIFYTGTRYDDEKYGKMVEVLHEIQQKWGIGVIDLWNDTQLNEISKDKRKLYMANSIHPTKAGYLLWWTPVMEKYLQEYLNK